MVYKRSKCVLTIMMLIRRNTFYKDESEEIIDPKNVKSEDNKFIFYGNVLTCSTCFFLVGVLILQLSEIFLIMTDEARMITFSTMGLMGLELFLGIRSILQIYIIF